MVEEYEEGIPWPFRDALVAFREHSPRDYEEERAGILWHVVGRHLEHAEQRELEAVAGVGRCEFVLPAVLPVVESLGTQPDLVETFFVVLWNALRARREAEEERGWREVSKKTVWTRRRLQTCIAAPGTPCVRKRGGWTDAPVERTSPHPSSDSQGRGGALARLARLPSCVGDGCSRRGLEPDSGVGAGRPHTRLLHDRPLRLTR